MSVPISFEVAKRQRELARMPGLRMPGPPYRQAALAAYLGGLEGHARAEVTQAAWALYQDAVAGCVDGFTLTCRNSSGEFSHATAGQDIVCTETRLAMMSHLEQLLYRR